MTRPRPDLLDDLEVSRSYEPDDSRVRRLLDLLLAESRQESPLDTTDGPPNLPAR